MSLFLLRNLISLILTHFTDLFQVIKSTDPCCSKSSAYLQQDKSNYLSALMNFEYQSATTLWLLKITSYIGNRCCVSGYIIYFTTMAEDLVKHRRLIRRKGSPTQQMSHSMTFIKARCSPFYK